MNVSDDTTLKNRRLPNTAFHGRSSTTRFFQPVARL
jgi:hypothetical protein